jgi:hypothetical protein
MQRAVCWQSAILTRLTAQQHLIRALFICFRFVNFDFDPIVEHCAYIRQAIMNISISCVGK